MLQIDLINLHLVITIETNLLLVLEHPVYPFLNKLLQKGNTLLILLL